MADDRGELTELLTRATQGDQAYTVTSGNRITLAFGAVSGDPSDLTFTLKLVRT